MNGLMFNKDGSPQMVSEFYLGKYLGRTHASVQVDGSLEKGDIVEIHRGYGLYNKYVVTQNDGSNCMLRRL